MGRPIGFCDSESVCHVFGGPDEYVIRVSATGFVSQDVRVTVTGASSGCKTCGRVDTQYVSVVLAPATGV